MCRIFAEKKFRVSGRIVRKFTSTKENTLCAKKKKCLTGPILKIMKKSFASAEAFYSITS